jgi:hypothetical protein
VTTATKCVIKLSWYGVSIYTEKKLQVPNFEVDQVRNGMDVEESLMLDPIF